MVRVKGKVRWGGVAKSWLNKNFATELGFMFGVMRYFQKGITLGGRASGSFHILNLQKWIVKFWHLG